MAEIIYSHLI